jgi:acetylornithine/succinyldiaminopimelate/putrescine aminotransferase
MDDNTVFFRHLAPTSPHPMLLNIVSAEGVFLTDVKGKKFIDLIAGIGVASVGHSQPKIIEAVERQLRQHAHVMVYGEYIQKPVNQLAQSLAALLPEPLETVYFVNSGTEANEAAIKLAKRVTGRPNIVAFYNSYHGNTQGSLSVSGNESRKNAFRPLIPGVRFLPFNDTSALAAIDHHTAAVIMEPIQGDAGVIIPDDEFILAAREQCDATDSLLIFDEVQTGMGRTGKMFAFEHFKVVPDIITLAKGLGGGLPIGAFIASHGHMQMLADKPMLGHITTFGGNPVCCAAALATTQIINTDTVLGQVEAKGALFEELLKHPNIKAMRRRGLMMAVELESEDKVHQAVKLALDRGIIIYWFLSTRNSFRISPPLTISEKEIKISCEKLLEVLSTL